MNDVLPRMTAAPRQNGVAMMRFALLTSLLLFSPGAFGAEVLEEIIEQRHSLDPDGSIQIYGSDRSEISIHAIKRAYTQERLKSIVVDVKATPRNVAIETIMPPKKAGLSLSDRSGTVEYV